MKGRMLYCLLVVLVAMGALLPSFALSKNDGVFGMITGFYDFAIRPVISPKPTRGCDDNNLCTRDINILGRCINIQKCRLPSVCDSSTGECISKPIVPSFPSVTPSLIPVAGPKVTPTANPVPNANPVPADGFQAQGTGVDGVCMRDEDCGELSLSCSKDGNDDVIETYKKCNDGVCAQDFSTEVLYQCVVNGCKEVEEVSTFKVVDAYCFCTFNEQCPISNNPCTKAQCNWETERCEFVAKCEAGQSCNPSIGECKDEKTPILPNECRLVKKAGQDEYTCSDSDCFDIHTKGTYKCESDNENLVVNTEEDCFEEGSNRVWEYYIDMWENMHRELENCGENEHCMNGRCIEQGKCEEDSDCKSGEVCNILTKECELQEACAYNNIKNCKLYTPEELMENCLRRDCINDKCVYSNKCEAGEVCHDSMCVKPCKDDDTENNIYVQGKVTGIWEGKEDSVDDYCLRPKVLVQYDCAEDRVQVKALTSQPCDHGCKEGRCLECQNDAHCNAEQVCEVSTGVCVTAECTVNTDCNDDGLICHNSKCIKPCEDDDPGNNKYLQGTVTWYSKKEEGQSISDYCVADGGYYDYDHLVQYDCNQDKTGHIVIRSVPCEFGCVVDQGRCRECNKDEDCEDDKKRCNGGVCEALPYYPPTYECQGPYSIETYVATSPSVPSITNKIFCGCGCDPEKKTCRLFSKKEIDENKYELVTCAKTGEKERSCEYEYDLQKFELVKILNYDKVLGSDKDSCVGNNQIKEVTCKFDNNWEIILSSETKDCPKPTNPCQEAQCTSGKCEYVDKKCNSGESCNHETGECEKIGEPLDDDKDCKYFVEENGVKYTCYDSDCFDLYTQGEWYCEKDGSPVSDPVTEECVTQNNFQVWEHFVDKQGYVRNTLEDCNKGTEHCKNGRCIEIGKCEKDSDCDSKKCDIKDGEDLGTCRVRGGPCTDDDECVPEQGCNIFEKRCVDIEKCSGGNIDTCNRYTNNELHDNCLIRKCIKDKCSYEDVVCDNPGEICIKGKFNARCVPEYFDTECFAKSSNDVGGLTCYETDCKNINAKGKVYCHESSGDYSLVSSYEDKCLIVTENGVKKNKLYEYMAQGNNGYLLLPIDCPEGQICIDGACVQGQTPSVVIADCQTGYSPCGSKCVNLNSDKYNCGNCGNVCAPGKICIGRVCVGPEEPKPGEVFCEEDDGGLNLYKKGVTKGKLNSEYGAYGTYEDKCDTFLRFFNTGSLTEYSCDNGFVKSQTKKCDSGCENGACVREQVEPSPTVTPTSECTSTADCLKKYPTKPNSICLKGKCECTRTSYYSACIYQSIECGEIGDGCGDKINCGDCKTGYECTDNVCVREQAEPSSTVTPAPECESNADCLHENPTKPNSFCLSGNCKCYPDTFDLACIESGVQCGIVSNGCGGEINCGDCGNGYTCVVGKCEPYKCVPLEPMDACGVNVCGTADDGCGGKINCGECSKDDENCVNGQCVDEVIGVCTDTCLNKECGRFKSDEGYICECGTCTDPNKECNEHGICVDKPTPEPVEDECQTDNDCSDGKRCVARYDPFTGKTTGYCELITCNAHCSSTWECGDDGCGGSCGSCGAGQKCVGNRCFTDYCGDFGSVSQAATAACTKEYSTGIFAYNGACGDKAQYFVSESDPNKIKLNCLERTLQWFQCKDAYSQPAKQIADCVTECSSKSSNAVTGQVVNCDSECVRAKDCKTDLATEYQGHQIGCIYYNEGGDCKTNVGESGKCQKGVCVV